MLPIFNIIQHIYNCALLDVDECTRPGMCQHSCRNTWGSFQCTCFEGYKLHDDQRTCRDIDECEVWAERGGHLCVGHCENTDGSYRCVCPDGFQLMADSRTCQGNNFSLK